MGNAHSSGKCADTRFSSHLNIGADMVLRCGGGDGGGWTKNFRLALHTVVRGMLTFPVIRVTYFPDSVYFA